MPFNRRQFLSGFAASTASIYTTSKIFSFNDNNILDIDNESIRVIGHRGCSATKKDNSIEGINCAINSNADGVELDIQITKDNYLILSHENYLFNSSGNILRIDNNNLNEIIEFSEEEIVLLDDALDIISSENNFEFFVGLKQPDTLEEIISRIESYNLLDNTTVQGWQVQDFEPFLDNNNIDKVLVSSFPSQSLIDEAVNNNIDSVMYHYTSQGNKYYNNYARSNGLKSGYWVINDSKSDIHRGLNTNPDFILTNRPRYTVELINNI